MIAMTQDEQKTLLEHMIETINEVGRGLTRWERSFIEDFGDSFARSGKFTPTQYQTVERIYDQRV